MNAKSAVELTSMRSKWAPRGLPARAARAIVAYGRCIATGASRRTTPIHAASF